MINRDEAITFLREFQPLPDDSNINKDIIDKYDEVRKYFLINAEDECVPLFLNSFGAGSGFGVYQLIEDVIRKYPKEVVLPHLIAALSSNYRGVRYWNAQISVLFPDERLVEPLKAILQEDDSDIRYAAITALQQIKDYRIEGILRTVLEKESDEEIIELIYEILGDIDS